MAGETDIPLDKKHLETNVLIIQFPLSDHLHIFSITKPQAYLTDLSWGKNRAD